MLCILFADCIDYRRRYWLVLPRSKKNNFILFILYVIFWKSYKVMPLYFKASCFSFDTFLLGYRKLILVDIFTRVNDRGDSPLTLIVEYNLIVFIDMESYLFMGQFINKILFLV